MKAVRKAKTWDTANSNGNFGYSCAQSTDTAHTVGDHNTQT